MEKFEMKEYILKWKEEGKSIGFIITMILFLILGKTIGKIGFIFGVIYLYNYLFM